MFSFHITETASAQAPVVERADTPAIRGMVAKVPHLVEFVD